MTAGERLTQALIDLGDHGQRPPCAGRDEWTSELAEERAEAATRCSGCSIIAACQAAADEADEAFGVWHGVDRTRKPGRTQRKAVT